MNTVTELNAKDMYKLGKIFSGQSPAIRAAKKSEANRMKLSEVTALEESIQSP